MDGTRRGQGGEDGAHLGAPYSPYSPHLHHPEGSPRSRSDRGASAPTFAPPLVENKNSLFHLCPLCGERRRRRRSCVCCVHSTLAPPCSPPPPLLSSACAGLEPAHSHQAGKIIARARAHSPVNKTLTVCATGAATAPPGFIGVEPRPRGTAHDAKSSRRGARMVRFVSLTPQQPSPTVKAWRSRALARFGGEEASS